MDKLLSKNNLLSKLEIMKKWFNWNSDYETGIKSWIDACIYKIINSNN